MKPATHQQIHNGIAIVMGLHKLFDFSFVAPKSNWLQTIDI